MSISSMALTYMLSCMGGCSTSCSAPSEGSLHTSGTLGRANTSLSVFSMLSGWTTPLVTSDWLLVAVPVFSFFSVLTDSAPSKSDILLTCSRTAWVAAAATPGPGQIMKCYCRDRPKISRKEKKVQSFDCFGFFSVNMQSAPTIGILATVERATPPTTAATAARCACCKNALPARCHWPLSSVPAAASVVPGPESPAAAAAAGPSCVELFVAVDKEEETSPLL